MRIKNSIIVITLLVLAFLALGGCEPRPLTDSERAALASYNQSVNQLGDFIGSQEQALADLEASFAAIDDIKSVEKVQKVRKALEETRGVTALIADGISTVADAETTTQALQTGVMVTGQSVAPFAGPYAPLVLAGSNLLTVLIGVFFGKRVGDEKIKSYNKAVERTEKLVSPVRTVNVN